MRWFQHACGRFSALIVGGSLLLSGLHAEGALPQQVRGLAWSGSATKPMSVSVRDAAGRLRTDIQPGITILKSSRWSPNDAERDGASEWEVFLSVAQLLKSHALAGIVGIGNQHGTFLPAAEQALVRAVTMGVPVVKLSASGSMSANSENLFIEAGSFSADEARLLLSEALLELGALPPAQNMVAPTASELKAIRHQVERYQAFFDHRARSAVRIASR